LFVTSKRLHQASQVSLLNGLQGFVTPCWLSAGVEAPRQHAAI
jgi:hypothetical protein